MTENPLLFKQQIGIRKLANQFLSHIKSTSVRRILVTSVQNSDGKAKFINELHTVLLQIQKTSFFAIEAEKLAGISPETYGDKLVVVYGPAYLDENGLHTLPEDWLKAFDAAIILVMKRGTNAKTLLEMIDWLQEYGISNIWPVLNEYNAPPIELIWPKLLSRLGLEMRTAKRKSKLRLSSVIKTLRDSWPALAKDKKSDTKPAKVTDTKQVKVTDTEPVKVTDTEPVKETDTEQVKETDTEPAKVTDTEPVKEADAEPVKETDTEPAKETDVEPTQSPGDHKDSINAPKNESKGSSFVTAFVDEPAFIDDQDFSSSFVSVSKTVSASEPESHSSEPFDPRTTMSLGSQPPPENTSSTPPAEESPSNVPLKDPNNDTTSKPSEKKTDQSHENSKKDLS
jgi:hypothetical protein